MAFLSFGDELCTYIAAQVSSPTLTPGQNLFSGRLTDQPDLQAGVWVGGGSRPPLTLAGGGATAIEVDEPNVQVMTRAGLAGYAAAESLIHAIYKVLQPITDVTLVNSGIVVKAAWALQHPTYIGRDADERHLFTQNYCFMYENANR